MDLEEKAGTPLLIRGKRQVTLTEAGVLFQQQAEEIVSLVDKTLRDITGRDNLLGGTVALGCVESCVSRILPKVLGGFSACYPNVKYELYSAGGDDIREKVDQGDLDFGTLVEPVEAVKYDFFRLPYWETWGFVMRKDDSLAQKERITKEDVLLILLILPRREIWQKQFPALRPLDMDWNAYDVVYLGMPNWWSSIAPPVESFLHEFMTTDKTIIPFCSYGGGGEGHIARNVRNYCIGCDVPALLSVQRDGGANAEALAERWLRFLDL